MYNKGEINQMDVVRKYGVIMDYQTNTALPISTEQYREAMKNVLWHIGDHQNVQAQIA